MTNAILETGGKETSASVCVCVCVCVCDRRKYVPSIIALHRFIYSSDAQLGGERFAAVVPKLRRALIRGCLPIITSASAPAADCMMWHAVLTRLDQRPVSLSLCAYFG